MSEEDLKEELLKISEEDRKPGFILPIEASSGS